jgi:acetyltransferase-like isoleucine patch superfamily enzyme
MLLSTQKGYLMMDNVKFKINGTGNELLFLKDGVPVPENSIKGLTITVNGNNNFVKIEFPSNFVNVSIVIDGNDNKFNLKPTKHRIIRHTTFGLEGGSEISVGSGFSAYRDINIVAKNGKNIYIGDECMFAREIMVRNNDGHIILDRNTGEVINPPEDIMIKDNVWIGMRVIILKGSVIPKGSVVGAMSTVNKKFDEENIIIAGSPAVKVRSNIEWRREDYARYIENNSQ